MRITKAIFDQIQPGEPFWTVRTRWQDVYDQAGVISTTYVCVKGKGGIDWTIYSAAGGGSPYDVARYGDKVTREDIIRDICPCDDEVYALYRH